MLDRAQAEQRLDDWLAALEVDPTSENAAAAKKSLVFAVMNERLNYDATTEVFRYKLLSPLLAGSNTSVIEILEIREPTAGQIKNANQSKGDDVARSIALVAQVCNLSVVSAQMLRQRDLSIINAVTMGFFMPTA